MQGKRQSGSSFKTFVLIEAVRQGINPFSTSYLSAPFHWQPDPNSEAWDVATYSHSYLGSVPIASATLSSDNTVYARLTLDVGPENVVRTARLMGIKTKLLPVASIGLGSNSVSVLEMASAYATLAAGGVFSEPMAIKKVVLASGEVDRTARWGKPKRRRVLTDGQAMAVTQILQDNMTGGTGTGAYYGDPYSAGKTGTTDEHVDAWFAGYTPRASTVVWVGYPNAQIEMNSVHGIIGRGRDVPGRYLAPLHAGRLRRPALPHLAGAQEPGDLDEPGPRVRELRGAPAAEEAEEGQGQEQAGDHDRSAGHHRASADDD